MIDKRPLKVAFYVGDLPSTTFINRLAQGLVKEGVEITMFGLIKKKFSVSKGVMISGARDGYKEGRISRYFRFLKFSILLGLNRRSDKKKLDNWIIENTDGHWNEKALLYPILLLKPDILHLQWVKAIKHFGWCGLFNIKLVVSLRGAHINYSPFTVPGLAKTYRELFPLVDGFHGVSNAICMEAAKYGAELNKCKVVYSGFDLNQFSMSEWVDKTQKTKSDPLKILSVGRSHWKKGYNFSLDAMSKLKAKHIPFQYTIIGAKGNEELIFQRHQLELDDDVNFMEQVPFKTVKQIIKEADILLLPSVEEGIANVVLEAMFMGTLVVTTNCGGMVESVENGKEGIVVPLRDSEAIVEALVQVNMFSKVEKQMMIEAAYKKVSRQHSENKMVQDMNELYQKLLMSNPSV